MGFQINTNVSALNAFSNMKRTQSRLDVSLQRLSSGLRINRAADDAAGMAIANRLNAQVEGLGQALKNANDGISMMQIADGALGQAIDIVTTIRTKASQASSDGVNADARLKLQADIDQLITQMDNIANTTTFNGIKMLDGSFSSKTLQVGAYEGETLSVSIGDNQASRIGALTTETTLTEDLAGGTALTALSAGDIMINGVAIGDSTSDGISYAFADASAIAKANAINDKTNQTGVEAVVQQNVVGGDDIGVNAAGVATAAAGAVQAGGVNNLDDTNTLTINNVQIGSNTNAISVLEADSDGSLRDAINAVSNQTGVVASLNDQNRLILTAEDGRNIQVVTGTAVADDIINFTGAASTYDLTAEIKLVSNEEAFVVSEFAVGDAQLQLGLGTFVGQTKTYDIDMGTAINQANVTTQSGAASAIDTADAALDYLNEQRANIGSIQMNLTSATANLSVMKTNIAAAESEIRNVDFAAEVANFTNQQVLIQAGTFALSQANSMPQQILQLLR